MLDVLDPAGTQVVEDDDLMAVGRQTIREVGPDESSPPGDQILHCASPFQSFS
jgi:hypothetical protein